MRESSTVASESDIAEELQHAGTGMEWPDNEYHPTQMLAADSM